MEEKKQAQWDKKAKNYRRYDAKQANFQTKIFQELEHLGITFHNKTVLDVGAGTGIYTIAIAKEAKTVLALDFSSQMLQVLQEDAKTHNVDNITTETTSWRNFTPQKTFDISLSTMSPALDSDEDFEKFDKSATTKIYLGWAGKRDSDILNALFEVHKHIYKAPNGSKHIKNWLKKNQKSFTCKDLTELKTSTCKQEEGIEKYKWHLEIREVNPDIELVQQVLKKFTKGGIITEKALNHINLIIWE
jgi:SAM-dependent methyltransferase